MARHGPERRRRDPPPPGTPRPWVRGGGVNWNRENNDHPAYLWEEEPRRRVSERREALQNLLATLSPDRVGRKPPEHCVVFADAFVGRWRLAGVA